MFYCVILYPKLFFLVNTENLHKSYHAESRLYLVSTAGAGESQSGGAMEQRKIFEF